MIEPRYRSDNLASRIPTKVPALYTFTPRFISKTNLNESNSCVATGMRVVVYGTHCYPLLFLLASDSATFDHVTASAPVCRHHLRTHASSPCLSLRLHRLAIDIHSLSFPYSDTSPIKSRYCQRLDRQHNSRVPPRGWRTRSKHHLCSTLPETRFTVYKSIHTPLYVPYLLSCLRTPPRA